MKNVPRLNKETVLLVVVDIQEKLAAVMDRRASVVANTIVLIRSAAILKIPVLVTEQYPKGLGRTVGEIMAEMPGIAPIEKMSFSCCGEPEFMAQLKTARKKQAILCGMETHVCILQTALDLLSHDYEVFIPENAVCSRHEEDRKAAFHRMRQASIVSTSTESAVFEMLGKAGTDEFKAVLKIIK